MRLTPIKHQYFDDESSIFEETYDVEIDFLTRVDRILSGNHQIMVNDQTEIKTAYYDPKNKKIGINFKAIRQETDDELLQIALMKGLNYHELAHNRYTTTKLSETHKANLWRFIKNALEDGRIETLFSNKYPVTLDYFKATCHNYITKAYKTKSVSDPELFLALYSRRLIIDNKPIIIWEKLFEQKYGQTETKAIKELIINYLLTYKYTEQNKIIEKIFTIMQPNAVGELPEAPHFGIGKKTYHNTESEADPKQQQTESKIIIKKLQNQTLTQPTPQETDAINKGIEQVNKIAKDFNKKMGENFKETQEIATKHSQSMKDYANAKTNEEKEDLRKKTEDLHLDHNKKRAEITTIQEETIKDLQKTEIINILTDLLKNSTNNIKKELQEDLNQIRAGRSPDIDGYSRAIITQQEETNAIKLTKVFKKLRNELKQGTISDLKSGIIETSRAMNYQKNFNTRIFQKHINKDQTTMKFGINLLIDTSGSMQYEMPEALKSAWIINKSTENNQNKIQIIGYNTNKSIIKTFEKKSNWNVPCGGGTDPTTALQHTMTTMEKARKQHRIHDWLTIIITDGSWADDDRHLADKIIETMNKKKIETILIKIDTRHTDFTKEENTHKCKHKKKIKTSHELPQVFEEIIKTFEKKIMLKAQTRIANQI